MPSINTMIMGLVPVAFSLLQICSAVPVAAAPATPSLPVNGGATELPAPTTSFVAVGLGRGTQNYSCSAVGAAPVAIGAIATLFDVTSLARTNPTALNALAASAVNTPAGRDGCYSLPAPYNRLAKLGNHFFLADGTPTFILSGISKSIQAKKDNGIPAPAAAPKGPSGTGAVDWLQLEAKPAPYTSVGLGWVYRVETAGGKQTVNCTAVGTQIQQYSAEYYFYAPS